jgi:hypothetical protein
MFNQKRKRPLEITIYLATSLFICILLIIRAIKVPMAHDELATFYYYVQSGKFNPFFISADTNNHFLNSFLAWVSFRVFGAQPWALRLPNLLFIPVFLISLYKLCSLFKSSWLRIVTFLAIAGCFHLVEFLALARGYGMSLSLLLLCIYLLIRWLIEQKNNLLLFLLLSIFVGCLANLALINIFALILLLVVVESIVNKRFKGNSLAIILTAGMLPFLFILAQVIFIRQHAGLVAGSPDGLWKVTIRTLFGYLFEVQQPFSDVIPASLFVLIALTFGVFVIGRKEIQAIETSPASVFVFLLAGSLLSMLILGHFFQVNYPDDRIGTYLYLLMIPAFTFSLNELSSPDNNKHLKLLAIPLLLVPMHLAFFINTSYSIWYKHDVIPESYYHQIMNNVKPGSPPPTVAAHGLRILCWNFLGYRHQNHVNPVFFTTYPSYFADYQIVKISEIPGWQNLYDTIAYDAISERHLLRLKESPVLKELASFEAPETKDCDREFFMLSEGDARDWAGKSLQVDLDVTVNSPEKPFISRIVVDINDRMHQSVIYEYIQLDWLSYNFTGDGQRFCNTLLLGKLHENSDTYKIYLWSIDKAPYSIKGKVSVNERIMIN